MEIGEAFDLENIIRYNDVKAAKMGLAKLSLTHFF
jgi:hypothetical protein